AIETALEQAARPEDQAPGRQADPRGGVLRIAAPRHATGFTGPPRESKMGARSVLPACHPPSFLPANPVPGCAPASRPPSSPPRRAGGGLGRRFWHFLSSPRSRPTSRAATAPR